MGGKGAHLGDLGWPAGRGSSRGRAGRRRRVDDEQDRRCASRGRAWTSRGGAEEEQDRRGGGRPAGWTSPGEEDRRRGRPNLTRGRANGAALPSNPPAPGSRGRAGIPPALRFGTPKLAALELALISRAYAPRPRPPSAAMRDYAPSRGDGLRPAIRCA